MTFRHHADHPRFRTLSAFAAAALVYPAWTTAQPEGAAPAAGVIPAAAAASPVTGPLFSPFRAAPLPTGIQKHGSAVVGNRIYVFGGSLDSPKGWSDKVFSAEIDMKGTLGTWKDERPLPERRCYIGNSVAVVNDRIYIVGGSKADTANSTEPLTASSTTLWCKVQPDGSLGSWAESAPFPGAARGNCAACASEDRLYVIGGMSNRVPVASVAVADFGPDGSPAAWRDAGQIPSPLYFHGTAVMEGRMYVWGGLTTAKNNSLFPRVVSCELGADGSVGAWRDETAMPSPTYSSSFCAFNDHLIAVGGRTEGGVPTGDLRVSTLEKGRPGPWKQMQTDLESRLYHSMGLDSARGWAFVTGGNDRTEAGKGTGRKLDTVRAFKMDAPATPAQVAAAPAAPAADAALGKRAAAAGKPALIYFRSPEVPACRRFEQDVALKPEFRKAASAFELAIVDITKDTATGYKYSVFRVPTLVMVMPDGTTRTSGMLTTMADVNGFLGSL